MAKVFHQSDEVNSKFMQVVRQKVEKRKAAMNADIDASSPPFVHWIVKPLANLGFDILEARDKLKGGFAETVADLGLHLSLPDTWYVGSNVVVEGDEGQLTQIDHLAIGPKGIFIIETKHWEAVLLCTERGDWLIKSGGRWQKCDTSPTRQCWYHRKVFWQWLKRKGLNVVVPYDSIYPVIFLGNSIWFAAKNPPVPVCESVVELRKYLLNTGKIGYELSQENMRRVVEALRNP